MNLADAKNLFDYNRWANGLTLDAAASISDEKFTIGVVSSYRSLRDTLTHILSAEWVYLMRCLGESPKQMLDPAIFADVKSVRMKWDEVNREWQNFIAQLSEETLQKEIEYTNFRGERWKYPLNQILQHVVNHSTYHRGQITSQLRMLGAKPVMTDYLYYWDLQIKGN
jgi:uncharacterized damage-inducible protein DinB